MPQFNDSENRAFIVLPEGDYKFEVIGFEPAISKGGKTSGSDVYKMRLKIEGSGAIVFEDLIDHPSTAWKMDTFLKSAGVKLARGENWTFIEQDAKNLGYTWVEPWGLRGWCRLNVDVYNGKTRNKVATFYTDKEKLPRAEPEPEPVQQQQAAPDTAEDDVPF